MGKAKFALPQPGYHIKAGFCALCLRYETARFVQYQLGLLTKRSVMRMKTLKSGKPKKAQPKAPTVEHSEPNLGAFVRNDHKADQEFTEKPGTERSWADFVHQNGPLLQG